MVIPQEALNARQEYGLTRREIQVLGLLIKGESEKAIAVLLAISRGTVRTHVVHIYQKMRVRTRAQLFATIYRDRD